MKMIAVWYFACNARSSARICACVVTSSGKGFTIARAGVVAVTPTGAAAAPVTVSLATASDYRYCFEGVGTDYMAWLKNIPGCTWLLNPQSCGPLLQVSTGSISCKDAVPAAAIDVAQSFIDQSNVGPLNFLGFQCYAGSQGVYCSRGKTTFTVQLP